MKKDRKAQIATMLVLLVALSVLVVHRAGWPLAQKKTDQTAQDTIYTMVDAARAGNVQAYLESYTGPLESSLRQSVKETTPSGFAKYLRDSNAHIKGIAVSDPQMITDIMAKVRVEFIYQDRNEAQMMYLEKGGSGWKISRADNDERVKTVIPYGTPVK